MSSSCKLLCQQCEKKRLRLKCRNHKCVKLIHSIYNLKWHQFMTNNNNHRMKPCNAIFYYHLYHYDLGLRAMIEIINLMVWIDTNMHLFLFICLSIVFYMNFQAIIPLSVQNRQSICQLSTKKNRIIILISWYGVVIDADEPIHLLHWCRVNWETGLELVLVLRNWPQLGRNRCNEKKNQTNIKWLFFFFSN